MVDNGESSILEAARSPALPIDAYRLLVERGHAALLIVQHGYVRFANPRLARLFGATSDRAMVGMDASVLAAPRDRESLLALLRRPLDAGSAASGCDLKCQRVDGSSFPGRVYASRIVLDGEAADLLTWSDESTRTQAVGMAQRRAHLLAQTEELAGIGSCEYDVETGVVTQSAGMFRIFGEPSIDAEVSGEWLMSRVPDSEEAYVRMILEGVRPGEPCEFEHRIVRADGALRTVLHRAVAEVDSRGHTVRVVGILRDITDQRRTEQRLDRLTHSCDVTDLPNRTALLDHLDATLRQVRRESTSTALLVCQIDQLKLVGESLGYAGSDALLAAVGQRLSRGMQGRDLVAHLGSGEYGLVPGRSQTIDEAAALAIGQALVDAFDAPFTIEGTEVMVTCGVGLTLYPGVPGGASDDSAQALLLQAQAARHRAHETGSNQVCVYDPDAHARAASRLMMEAALRRALLHGEFHLRYQPQLDLTTGLIAGVEALIRWSDPVRGLVSPVDFIPLAEETGLIVPIGEWVLRTACEQAVAWRRAGLPALRMAVNLSVKQLQQPDIAQRIQTIVLETGLDPCHLGLEITESVLMGESTHVSRTLVELKAIGIEISLDDFGTGYSNLSYLRTLPIDVVKVDRSFVHDVTAAPQDVSVTRAVITMAHSLQMKVLAEGVETEGQLALLIANRCDQIQGYYFSPPVTAEAIVEMLNERRQLPVRLLRERARERTLLLVDDDELILSMLEHLFQHEGYHVLAANSGAKGLARLAEHDVDVIVSDQWMPGMSGVEFLSRAKELFPDTVRIVLSAYCELEAITEAINQGGIYKFLTKPLNNDQLRGHVAAAFKHKELADDNRQLVAEVISAKQALADAQRQLQQLRVARTERERRDDTSLVVAREVLEHIPAPVIGIDLEGMIAFVNADAESLFAHEPSLLGREAREALPVDLCAVWHISDGQHHGVNVAGRPFQAVCRLMSDTSPSRGSLLVLAPAA